MKSTGVARSQERREAPDYPAGQEFDYWLGQAARRLREEREVTPLDIAGLLSMKTSKGVERFERNENRPQTTTWIVAAYGLALNMDPRDIYEYALKIWHEEGEAPRWVPSPSTRAGIAKALAEGLGKAARQRGAAEAATPRAPRAKRPRQDQ